MGGPFSIAHILTSPFGQSGLGLDSHSPIVGGKATEADGREAVNRRVIIGRTVKFVLRLRMPADAPLSLCDGAMEVSLAGVREGTTKRSSLS